MFSKTNRTAIVESWDIRTVRPSHSYRIVAARCPYSRPIPVKSHGYRAVILR